MSRKEQIHLYLTAAEKSAIAAAAKAAGQSIQDYCRSKLVPSSLTQYTNSNRSREPIVAGLVPSVCVQGLDAEELLLDAEETEGKLALIADRLWLMHKSANGRQTILKCLCEPPQALLSAHRQESAYKSLETLRTAVKALPELTGLPGFDRLPLAEQDQAIGSMYLVPGRKYAIKDTKQAIADIAAAAATETSEPIDSTDSTDPTATLTSTDSTDSRLSFDALCDRLAIPSNLRGILKQVGGKNLKRSTIRKWFTDRNIDELWLPTDTSRSEWVYSGKPTATAATAAIAEPAKSAAKSAAIQ